MNTNDTPAKDLLFPETADITPAEALGAFSHRPARDIDPSMTPDKMREYLTIPVADEPRSEFQRILDQMDAARDVKELTAAGRHAAQFAESLGADAPEVAQAIDVQTYATPEHTPTMEEETPHTPQEAAALRLNDYTLARLCLETYIQQNASIINYYGQLQKVVVETENEVKDAVRALGTNIENDSFTVTVAHPVKRWYDAGFIIDNFPAVVDMPGVMEVNRDMVAMLAQKGNIPKAIADAALREEAQTPRVSIKVKQ